MNSSLLAGKVAVVTGGSSGIGAACVRLLAKEGATVVIGYNAGEDRAQALQIALDDKPHSIARIALDDFPSHEALAATLSAEYGAVDILVNSAGKTLRVAHDDMEQMNAELYRDILVSNAAGTFP